MYKLRICLFLIIHLLLFNIFPGYTQTIRQLEDRLNNTYGVEKLESLNRLTEHYYQQNSRRALKYGKQAVTIGENIYKKGGEYTDEPDVIKLVTAYNQLGQVYYKKGDYTDAQDNFRRAERIANFRGFKTEWDLSILYLNRLDSLSKLGEVKENFFSRTLGNLEIGEMINETSEDIKINNEIRVAEKRTEEGLYQDAIEHYKKAINLLENQGKTGQINTLKLKIADLYEKLEDYAQAREILGEAIAGQKELMDSGGDDPVVLDDEDTSSFLEAPTMSEEDRAALQTEKETLRKLISDPGSQKDPGKSIELFKRYQELSQKIREDSIQSLVEKERRNRDPSGFRDLRSAF
jgi:tetratricopeptide (TPR) repeat protein